MRAFQRNESIKEEKHLSGTRLNKRQRKVKQETYMDESESEIRNLGTLILIFISHMTLGKLLTSVVLNYII
jgi:hypothetical protein